VTRTRGNRIGTPGELAAATPGKDITVTRYRHTATVTAHERRCLWYGATACLRNTRFLGDRSRRGGSRRVWALSGVDSADAVADGDVVVALPSIDGMRYRAVCGGLVWRLRRCCEGGSCCVVEDYA
jgi:hypothetical protein